MGDIDHGGIDALVKGFDLRAQLHPQLGVKVRQRLIEQENLGVSDHGPAHRHPLALAAGERSRIASQQFINPQQAGDLLHFAFL